MLLLNGVFGLICAVALCLKKSVEHSDCQIEPFTPIDSVMKNILMMLVLLQNNAVQWLLFKD